MHHSCGLVSMGVEADDGIIASGAAGGVIPLPGRHTGDAMAGVMQAGCGAASAALNV